MSPAPPGARDAAAPRALVVGSLALDTIVREGVPPASRLGGAVTYAGLTYRRLGVAAGAVFNLAARDRGALAALEREALELRIGASAETTRFVNRLTGERRTQEVPSRARPIAATLVAEALAGRADGARIPRREGADGEAGAEGAEDAARPPRSACAIVHLGPLHADDVDLGVAAVLARSGARIALDVQGLVRRVGPSGVTHVLRDGALPLLRCCRVLKGDEDEIAALATGLGLSARAEARAEVLRALDLDELVVTAGSRGGVIVTPGGDVAYDAEPPHDHGDSTGAGDVFLAAYMTHRVARALPVREAAREGARVAACQVAGTWIAASALALGADEDRKE